MVTTWQPEHKDVLIEEKGGECWTTPKLQTVIYGIVVTCL